MLNDIGTTHKKLRLVKELPRSTFNCTHFRITVAEFKKRALKAWKKAGFLEVQTFQARDDGEPFIVLMRHI